MSLSAFNKKIHTLARSKNAVIVAVPLAVVLNILCANLSTQTFHLPFFMDTIWTFVVAAFYGVLPGIMVGLLYNIVVVLLAGNIQFIWFGFVGVFNALMIAFFCKKSKINSILTILLLWLVLTLGNSFLGAVIAFFAFADKANLPPSINSVMSLLISIGEGMGVAAFRGRIFVNFIDKGFALLIMLPLYHWYIRPQKDTNNASPTP